MNQRTMSSDSMGDTDRLAEIDRELDSFGKSDEALAAVVARARALVPGGLEAADAALEGLGGGSASLATPAPSVTNGHDRAPPARAVETVVETRAPAGTSARPARWDEPGPSRDELPEDASGVVELPEELLRREPLPAVLALGEAPVRAAEAPAHAPDEAENARADAPSLELELDADLAAAIAETAPATIEGGADGSGSLEALFDDASLPPPVGEDPTGTGGLADLFESDRPEPEPAAHQSLADLLTPELQAELGGDLLGGDPLQADVLGGDALGGDALGGDALGGDALGEDDDELGADESTAIFSAADLQGIRAAGAPESLEGSLEPGEEPAAATPSAEELELGPSGEFELMIDEDVLVLDDSDEEAGQGAAAAAPPPPGAKKPTMPPPPIPSPGSQPPPPDQKGFFSRILNRK